MKQLTHLLLSKAGFGGSLPGELGNLHNLVILDLLGFSLSTGRDVGREKAVYIWIFPDPQKQDPHWEVVVVVVLLLIILDLSSNAFTNIKGGISGILQNSCSI